MSPHPRAAPLLFAFALLISFAARGQPAAVDPGADPRDPCDAVVDQAGAARDLYDWAKDFRFRGTVPSDELAPEPERSMTTTAVHTEASLITRANSQTELAEECLDFFRERGFCSAAGLEAAETATGELRLYLQENGELFHRQSEDARRFADGEASRVRAERTELEERFHAATDPEERARLEGRINLATLRLARLEELGREAAQNAEFFESFAPLTAPETTPEPRS
jgi:ribosomal protein S18 acetylase RimI-like enzyme